MTKKFKLEEAKNKLFEKHGNKISMFNYVSMSLSADFLCNICGNKWVTNPTNVITAGRGCQRCYFNYRRKTHQGKLSENDVRSFIEAKSCVWVSGIYENNHSYLEIQFECGCIGNITYCNFKNGRRCRFHQREKAAKKRRTSFEYIKKDIENHGFVFLEIVGDGFGRRTMVVYFCSSGHRTERYYKDFINHPNCEVCEIEKRKTRFRATEDEIKNLIESAGCNLIDIKYYENEKKSQLEIEFSCGHKECLSMTNFRGRKSGLCVDCELESRSGETSVGWKGGITPLTQYIRKQLSDWNSYCAEYYNYRCVITDKPMEHIHHLQSFNLILKETIDELNIEIKKNVSDYTEDELDMIVNKFFEIQSHYPIGVPVSTRAHHTFHKFYGRGDNTPDQFYEFIDRVKSRDIIIPD